MKILTKENTTAEENSQKIVQQKYSEWGNVYKEKDMK